MLRSWLSDLLGVLYVWVNGVEQTQSSGLEFSGSGVSVAYNPTLNRNVISFSGSGGGGGVLSGGNPIASASLTFSLTAGTADVTAYTVAASPSGTNRFVITDILIRLATAITGSGSVTVQAGTTAGGTDLLVTSASWTSGTAAGTVVGLNLTDLGTAFTATTSYRAALAAAATVKARSTTTGTITGGAVTVDVYGFLLP